MSTLPELRAKFRAIWSHLDERTRRLIAANEAKTLGRGGVSLVSRACGLSRKAIHKGIREIEAGVTWPGRIRRPGGGRKPITQSDPQLVHRLEADRGDDARRSGIAAALDLQEYARPRRCLDPTPPSCKPYQSGPDP